MDIKNYIGNHHVHRIDQYSMFNSIESRFPVLDHELINFSFRMPSKYKLKNNCHKFILKEVAKELIPLSIIQANKKGFSLPMDHYLRTTLKIFVKDQILKLQDRRLVNSDFVGRLYKNFHEEKESHSTICNL